jgi:ABC-type antimicrobial peptide transport system permease subunit
MLSNYLKIAFRNLLRHKGFSFINIFGLGIGMASSILVLLWVLDELSYDNFHNNSQNTFRIISGLPELNVTGAITSAPLAAAFSRELPEIKKIIRIQGPHTDLLQIGEKLFEEKKIFYADSNFLQFFTFALKAGNPKTALLQPESIVITEAMAKKYFGTEDAIGKVIRKSNRDDLTVTGVLADIPENSHLQFDFVIPMTFLARTERDLKENIWDNFNFYTYVQLDQKTASSRDNLLILAGKFKDIYKANEPKLRVQFTLQPLDKIHLHSNFIADLPGHGNIQYVYIFSVVGIFILAVACINFMNLATARSARRAKEVGLRKVAGALRFQLIRQFLAESSLIAFLSLLLGLAIVFAALPAFNDLAGKSLGISFLNLKMVLALITITFITGLLAGSYPAFFLSSFVPAAVLKGNLKSGATSATFRNIMVVVQFTVSITLLVGTTVVYNQLQYIKNKNIGFDKENLIYTPMTGALWKNYHTLRTSLEQNSQTTEFAVVSDLPTFISSSTVGLDWPGKDPNTQPLFSTTAIDDKAMAFFKFTLLSGRNFSKDIGADSVNLIMNEAALKTMNMEVNDAVGKEVTFWGNKGTIIGVVKDFNFQPLQKSIDPLILRYNRWGGIIVVRTKPQQVKSTVAELEHVFKTLNPDFPFSYNFVEQDLENRYKAEHRLSALFKIFAGLAIFISCLGLYGLSAFLAERRTKEIGVRKVLGASVSHVVYLLSKTFTKPIVVAMLIATPLSWYVMNEWLSGFAYHVTISWTIFLIAFVVSLSIAWATVSFESIKAAIADPAKSLRDE